MLLDLGSSEIWQQCSHILGFRICRGSFGFQSGGRYRYDTTLLEWIVDFRICTIWVFQENYTAYTIWFFVFGWRMDRGWHWHKVETGQVGWRKEIVWLGLVMCNFCRAKNLPQHKLLQIFKDKFGPCTAAYYNMEYIYEGPPRNPSTWRSLNKKWPSFVESH